MRLLKTLVLFCAVPVALLFLGLSDVVIAQNREPLYIQIKDTEGLLVAAQKGDVATLDAVAKRSTKALVTDLALGMAARARGDLTGADKYFKTCVESAGNAPDLDHVAFITFCGEAIAGNSYMRGDIPGWAQYLQATIGATRPYFEMTNPGRPLVFPDVAGIDLDTLAKIPPLHSRVKAPIGATLPRVARSAKLADAGTISYDAFDDTSSYQVALSINGQSVRATFDTGSNVTALTQADADQLYLPVIASSFLTLKHPHATVSAKTDLRQVKDLQAGTIDFGAAQVASGVNDSLLGLDMIRSLGAIKITEQGVVLLKTVPPTCSNDITLASNWAGNYSIVGTLLVDGKKSRVFIDTGSNGPLTVYEKQQTLNPSAAYTVGTASVVGGTEVWRTRETKTDLEGQSVTLRHVVSDEPSLFDYTLGAGVLKSVDILIDLKQMKMCVVAKDAQPKNQMKAVIN